MQKATEGRLQHPGRGRTDTLCVRVLFLNVKENRSNQQRQRERKSRIQPAVDGNAVNQLRGTNRYYTDKTEGVVSDLERE